MTEAMENNHPWRQGRKVGRTIYMQLTAQPTDADPLIGVMDSPELAREAVDRHNDHLLFRSRGGDTTAVLPWIASLRMPGQKGDA